MTPEQFVKSLTLEKRITLIRRAFEKYRLARKAVSLWEELSKDESVEYPGKEELYVRWYHRVGRLERCIDRLTAVMEN